MPSFQSGNAREKDVLSLMPYHAVFGFLIQLLVAVIQVNVQGTNRSPFETHPANMCAFLVATFIYCFAFIADVKCKLTHHTGNSHTSLSDDYTSYAQLFGLVASISGSFSAVSIVTIVVPPLFGYIIFISWAFVSTFFAYQHAKLIKETFDSLIKKTSYWLLHDIKDPCNELYKKICDKASGLMEQRLLELEAV